MIEEYKLLRTQMVESQIRIRGIKNPRLLAAMEKVPRHLFFEEKSRDFAYMDGAFPIDAGQTISQPYIVALMTEALDLHGTENVLEIGTGSGYQTAILAELANSVYTVERIPSLSFKACALLNTLGYRNITFKTGDGSSFQKSGNGFDAIIITAGAPKIADVFIEELVIGGRLVLPVGGRNFQNLVKVTKFSNNKNDIKKENLGACRFLNLIGENGWPDY